MVRCPVCGTRLDFAEMALTDRQRKIRAAIEQLKRENGRWPYSREIAMLINYSDGLVRQELRRMEKIGILRRDGPRSGWALRVEHLTVISSSQ